MSPGAGHVAQVAAEGREAAAVASHLDAVHPHRRVMIHRLEVQQRASPGPCHRDGHFAPIPDGFQEVVVADARELRFRAEGHEDAVAQLALQQAALEAAVPLVKLELPFAVEAEPVAAHELGTRIFTAGYLRHFNLLGALKALH